MSRLRRGFLLATAVSLAGCASSPPAPAGPGCRAVGRLVVEGGRRGGVDATAVLHLGERSIALRIVSPDGKTVAELRSDGRRVRISRRDEKTWWEEEGSEALGRVLGERLDPAEWIATLRGERGAPEGWSLEESRRRSCLPERQTLTGKGGTRLRVEWSGIEGWLPESEELPPPPAGYRRVEELRLREDR